MTLSAKKREQKGRATNALRAEGIVPGVVYGFEIDPMNVQVDRNALEKAYIDAGESTILNLDVEGTEYSILIQDIQRDPLTDFITHADFRRVNMKQKVEATITLELTGEAPAVKELGGTLIQALEEVEVLALPAALVRDISVSVVSLKTFDDAIHVSDIQVPAGIEILTEGNQTIALVQPPRSEEEMAKLDEAVEGNVEAVEITTEKKEGEEEKTA